MCGIAGVLGAADEAAVARMIEAMAHRGPDDVGVYVDREGGVALGHRRLSIIDLSSAGHQPMSGAEGRHHIVYNGEVYNFAELRAELTAKGHRFRSNSDTEVLLAAYASRGALCLDRLRGMFAFAVWDKDEKELFLARDRFGIKPLYWAESNGRVVFASELKGMLASGLISRQLDAEAVSQYLSLGSVQAPRTILANVSAILPGHYLRIKNGRKEQVRYWDLPRLSENNGDAIPADLPEVEEELRRLLEESIRLHMIADVPVGAFLSGGVDSTAVVSLMSRALNRPLKTFSVGFRDAYKPWNDLPYAEEVAQRFDTEHQEVIVTGEDVATEFEPFIQAIDQPSSDGINTYFVSKFTRQSVTVALSGLGGDELFAGYPHFRRLQIAERFHFPGDPMIKSGLRFLSHFGPGRVRKAAELLGARDFAARYAATRRMYQDDEKRRLLSPELRGEAGGDGLADLYGPYVRPELDVVARTTYLETGTYMANTLLRDTDATSMSQALEVRVPLLDHVLAEFAFRLKPRMKLDRGRSKVAFVGALRDVLPESVVNRPKRGFEIPIGHWLPGPLWPTVREVLTSAETRRLFSGTGVASLLAQAGEPRASYAKVWAPLVLAAWAQRHRCVP